MHSEYLSSSTSFSCLFFFGCSQFAIKDDDDDEQDASDDIAGDSAPIYLAARYWLIKETLHTNKAKNRFLGSDFSLGSVKGKAIQTE